MFKKFVLTSGGVALIVVLLVGIKMSQFKAMGAAAAAMVMPPETVTAAPVHSDVWENSISATGSLAAVQGVTVGVEVAGKITEINFEPGAAVKAGDILVRMDVSTEEAQLRAAAATAELAADNFKRAKELRESNSNSVAELDAADAQAQQAAAQADSIRALIAKKTIRAPFAGRLGLRLVNLGQIVSVGEAITTLQTMDPIYVNFAVPQQRLHDIVVGSVVRISTDAAPGQSFEGKITAISPEIDAATRNIRIQGTVGNKDEKLRPGMFARIDVVLPTKDNVLAIPATSILYAPYGDTVFVIEEKKNEKTGQTEKVLRQQFVRLGTARGDFVRVVDGLKEGEQVVTSGVFKLRPGMTVVIDNKLAPKAQLNPKPTDS